VTPLSTWRLIVKDLRLGPRSPVFLYAIALPIVMTFLIAGVFGSLLEPVPRLAIADLGESQVTSAASGLRGVEVTVVSDAAELISRVEIHDFDAGLVLPAGFDTAAAAGEDPGAVLYMSGSSLAGTRLVLVAVVADLIDGVTGAVPAVDVVVTRIGDDDVVPIGDRLVPMMVFYAAMIAGLFLPAASLLEERESGTIDALLVSPVQMGDVLVAKGVVATGLATTMAMVTLGLNDAFGGRPFLLLLILVIGSAMLAEFGLVLGMWAKDANTLFTTIKGGGIFIFLPVIFTIWPNLPQWIPRLAPTYYFLNPVYEVGVLGAGPGDVWVDIVVAVAICVVMAPLVMAYGRRVERRLAIAL